MHSNENFSPRQFQIAAHLLPNTVSERTRAALSALGYQLVPQPARAANNAAAGANLNAAAQGSAPDRTALRLVDDRLLGEIPSPANDPTTPIVLLSTARSSFCADPRVVARALRPAELDELFPLLQSELEGTPRRAPRTRVALPARCVQADRRWLGAIVELSTTGCLVESREWRRVGPLEPGSRMNLHFTLPASTRGANDSATSSSSGRTETLTTRAECREVDATHVGLEFCGASDEVRERVADYVAATLAG